MLGIILTFIGCFMLWWRGRALSYPISLRPTIYRIQLISMIAFLFGIGLIAFGLFFISEQSLTFAVSIAIVLLAYQVIKLLRNTTKSRIDRIFKCYRQMKIANIFRQNRKEPLLDEAELFRGTAILYAKKQGWPSLKFEVFRVSFIDTESASKVTNIKDLAYSLLLFEIREENMDEWNDKHFNFESENSKYLDELCERFNETSASKLNN